MPRDQNKPELMSEGPSDLSGKFLFTFPSDFFCRSPSVNFLKTCEITELACQAQKLSTYAHCPGMHDLLQSIAVTRNWQVTQPPQFSLPAKL